MTKQWIGQQIIGGYQMFYVDYNPVKKRNLKRREKYPKELVDKLDHVLEKGENLQVIKRRRNVEVNTGDVFVLTFDGTFYFYGKVLLANIDHIDKGNWINGCHVIFVFKNKTLNKTLDDFKPDYDNLFADGPKIVTTGYWKQGRFETIGNIPLTEEEKNLDYGFSVSIDFDPGFKMINADGTDMDHMPKYFNAYGVLVYTGIYSYIKNAAILEPSILEPPEKKE